MGSHFNRGIGSVCTKEILTFVVNTHMRPCHLALEMPRSLAAKVLCKKYLTVEKPCIPDSEDRGGNKT